MELAPTTILKDSKTTLCALSGAKWGIPAFEFFCPPSFSVSFFFSEKELCQDIAFFRDLSGSVGPEPSPVGLEDTAVIVRK